MARRAGPAEGTAMGIVTAVAAKAVHRKLSCRHILFGVTVVACDRRMLPGQREACVLPVIEAPEHPAIWIVATFARFAEAALVVDVVVARVAGARHILKRLALMASLARHRGVKPNQGKTREVVVEGDFLAPSRFIVARLALCAELAFVRIVLLVTGGTTGRELVSVDIARVAAIAQDLPVLAAKREFRFRVVIEF